MTGLELKNFINQFSDKELESMTVAATDYDFIARGFDRDNDNHVYPDTAEYIHKGRDSILWLREECSCF